MADIYLFLKTYFPGVFYQPFTDDRREMIDAVRHAAKFGGDQAVAGPRADGKTRSALFTTLQQVLAGAVTFPVIISKSGPRASRELRNLKDAITSSPLLAADFPEFVEPIIALGRWAARARQQTVYGRHTDMEWGEDTIIFPTIPTELLHRNGWNEDFESSAQAQIIASLGIEGSIRGFSVRNRRPDLAILDDIDDRDSARSELQTDTRERIIEEDVGGLAGPDKTIARVMLCTLINRTCIAATFTDQSKKSSWRGQRHKLLQTMPTNMDRWDEYMRLRQDRGGGDPDARLAHQYYVDHRADMDAGAVVTNPYRFDARKLLDGSQSEISALQACFNLIADRGLEHFNTEYQNDPPEETAAIESGITAHRVQRQLSEVERGLIPAGCKILVQGIDVSKRALHWVVRAFRADGTGFTIDYGITEVYGTDRTTEEGVDVAVRRAILARMDETKNADYAFKDGGEVLPVDLTLIDAGWQTAAVYSACKTIGGRIMPLMGFGKSNGCVKTSFNDAQKQTADRMPGDGFFVKKREKQLFLVCSDADRWKAWEHDRWQTAPGMPGSMQLFGEGSGTKEMSADEKAHHTYAHHIANEVEVEEVIKGAHRRRWLVKGANHYLDASCYANVAGAMKGVRLLRARRDPPAEPAKLENGQAAQASAKAAEPAKPTAKNGRPKRKLRKASYL